MPSSHGAVREVGMQGWPAKDNRLCHVDQIRHKYHKIDAEEEDDRDRHPPG